MSFGGHRKGDRMSQAMIVQTQFLSKRYEIKNCVGTSALEVRLNWNHLLILEKEEAFVPIARVSLKNKSEKNENESTIKKS